MNDQKFYLVVDRIFDSVDAFGTKVLSGRLLTTVAIVGTYCFLAIKIVGSIPPDKISSDFVMGFVAGFSGTVVLVLKAYFDRTDRKPEGEKDGKIIPGVN